MDTATIDLPADALAEDIAGNVRELFVSCGSLVGETIRREETTAFFTGVPHPMFNGVIRPRLSPESADEGIDWFIEQARSRGVPMMWQVSPGSAPDTIEDLLVRHGFAAEGSLPGMAADLRPLVDEPCPDGVTVERIRDLDTLTRAASLMCHVFGFPEVYLEFFVRILAIGGTGEDATLVNYAAAVGDELVGTSSAYYGSRVAGIYNVATLTDYRGRGIGRALTLAPLLDARRRGYRMGILQSSQMGISVYRRLGFDHYCDFTVYVWSAEGAASRH